MNHAAFTAIVSAVLTLSCSTPAGPTNINNCEHNNQINQGNGEGSSDGSGSGSVGGASASVPPPECPNPLLSYDPFQAFSTFTTPVPAGDVVAGEIDAFWRKSTCSGLIIGVSTKPPCAMPVTIDVVEGETQTDGSFLVKFAAGLDVAAAVDLPTQDPDIHELHFPIPQPFLPIGITAGAAQKVGFHVVPGLCAVEVKPACDFGKAFLATNQSLEGWEDLQTTLMFGLEGCSAVP